MGKGARTKGYFKNTKTKEILKFKFNPSELGTSRGVEYNHTKSCGSDYPTYQYTGGGAETLSFDLYYKGTSSEVLNAITFLESFTPSKNPTNKYNKPPTILFCFGSFMRECLLTSLEINRTMFDSNLNPTEIKVPLKLEVLA